MMWFQLTRSIAIPNHYDYKFRILCTLLLIKSKILHTSYSKEYGNYKSRGMISILD